MRPLTLKMQAFGPYAQVETIDFNKLENRKMFVISGKTGSGKTSIFDGISFAIYGEASGEGRAGSELRSHFAKEDVTTEVSLIFSLKNKTYYIQRSPQQQRKKTRGEGYTTVNAKAELYVMNEEGSWKLLTANVRDTNEKVREIMQLDANQFRQILMIPQGEFRKLLTSDSKEKEIILQRLFHTELYKKIENNLREKANELKAEVETGISMRNQTLLGLFTNGNEQLEAALQEYVNDLEIIELTETVNEEMNRSLKELQLQINKQQKKRDIAKRQLDEATDLLKEMAQRDELLKQMKELELQKESIAQLKQDVRKAHKAQRLQHQEDLCVRLRKAVDRAQQEKNEQQKIYEQAKQKQKNAEQLLQQEEGKQKERDHLKAQLVRLESVKDAVYSFAERTAEQDRLDLQLKAKQQLIQKKQAERATTAEKIERKKTAMTELNTLQLETVKSEREVNRLQDILQKMGQLKDSLAKETTLVESMSKARSKLERAKARAQDAKETVNHLEDVWRSGHAAVLAQTLEKGCPCPVCGSNDHPSRAESTGELPNEEDLKAAKQDAQACEQQLLEAERNWMRIATETDYCKESIVNQTNELQTILPNVELNDLPQKLQQFKQIYKKQLKTLQQTETKISQIPALEQQLAQLENDQIAIEQSLVKMEQDEKNLSVQLIELTTSIQHHERNIPEGLTNKGEYDEQVRRFRKKSDEMEKALSSARHQFSKINEQVASVIGKLANVEEAINKAEAELTVERNTFVAQLQEEEFSNYREYEQSKRTEETLVQMEEKIKAFGEEFRSVGDRLKDYNERLANQKQPEKETLEAKWKEQETILSSLNENYANMSMNVRTNKEIIEKVHAINVEIKEAEEHYKVLGHLSDITRGQNTYKLTFERFVLASFLEDILAAANIRLLRMTSGRYQLLRKTDRSKGNVQSGLEILVFDHYTGQERHVKTLSGGESFKAALSLALGLADIVQEYAGGVSLETMFIDEGFGTLDPESLDHAIEALMDIQSSGRLVGLISHVPELKERIDARLEVIAGQNGSKTEFVFLS